MSNEVEFHANPEGGSTTVLGFGKDITVEASLGRMYDEGYKSGYQQGVKEAAAAANMGFIKARKEGHDEGVRYEKARRKEKKRRQRLIESDDIRGTANEGG